MGSSGSKARPSRPDRQAEITDRDRAELDLKNARDKLRRYRRQLEADAERMQKQALALVRAGRRDRALMVLKLKKLKEKRCAEADAQLLNVYTMLENISWETQNLMVFEALREGKDTLNEIHRFMSVDQVEQLMDDSAEAIATQQEISSILSGAAADAVDEDEILSELSAIQGELDAGAREPPADAEATPGVAEQLPAVPTATPVAAVPAGAQEGSAAEPVLA